jgi:hypothetical protein
MLGAIKGSGKAGQDEEGTEGAAAGTGTEIE